MTATLKDTYNRVVGSSAQKLRGLGFVRRGTTFRKVSHGNAAIIEFQRSTKSDRHEVLFTINIGIVCGKLIEEGQPPLTRAGSVDAHLRLRIGMLLPERFDKWWQITEETDGDKLAAEVSGLILDQVVPYLERYLDTDALVALWESGKSPGLTETQRIRYLAKADAARASTT